MRIAFIGLGIMGRPMAENLLRAGFEVIAWNRTRARAEELAEQLGAGVAGSPAEAASMAEMTITIVPDVPEVEEVLLGERGAAEGARDGHLVVDMSTIAPSATRRIAEQLAGRAIGMLDAPVTGSRPKAEDGTLTIMVGGEPESFERARPVLEAMGELVLHLGPQGHGSMTKLVNNTVAAVNAAALAEALLLARRAGLDTDALRRVMAAGSGASAMLQLKAEPMLERDLEPLFKLDHMLKDVRHCLAEAKALGAPLPLAREAARLYADAARRGLGGRDFAAVVEVVEGAEDG
jgi:3-hydroxyisobutyrate dehydrogenase-like beta-hydroxyacid dehydrogenase